MKTVKKKKQLGGSGDNPKGSRGYLWGWKGSPGLPQQTPEPAGTESVEKNLPESCSKPLLMNRLSERRRDQTTAENGTPPNPPSPKTGNAAKPRRGAQPAHCGLRDLARGGLAAERQPALHEPRPSASRSLRTRRTARRTARTAREKCEDAGGRGGRWEGGKVGRWEGGKVGRWEGGKVGRWEGGKVGRWEGGKVGRWEGGKVGRWEGGKVGRWVGGFFGSLGISPGFCWGVGGFVVEFMLVLGRYGWRRR